MKQPDLGNKIRELRNNLNLSQEELADKSELNIRSVQRIEAGEVVPRGSTMRLLAEALQYDFKPQAVNSDLKLWIFLLHMSNLFPVVIFAFSLWILKKDEFAEVDRHGKDVINFQISMSIYLFSAAFLAILLIGIPILIGLGIFCSVMSILNTLKAMSDNEYHYPMTIAFIK